ncbi:hypothetical protein [Methylocapsa sp. S129]|uniref:hypothetical protein n=1 Tax=Methylocapsa sp. S129 TaxID=1641869 RepID=UPI00131A82A1|nr:hypothetical protein [Methylocapsa sp. S129]
MTRQILKCGAVLTLLLASASAYADDPTGVLLQEQRAYQPRAYGAVPAFSDVGPCQPGTQSEPFPNGQGYRCIATQQ